MKKSILSVVLALGLLAMVVTPVLAATYKWTTEISVSEYGGNDRTDGVPVLVDFGTASMVTLGYLDSTGRESRMREADYGRPYTLETSRLGLVVHSLTSYQSAVVDFYTGYSTGADYDLVVGPTGYVTRAYDVALEFGDTFEIELKGFIDTSYPGAGNKNLVLKDTAFKIYISAEDAITASIFNVNWVTTFITATDVVSGIYRVRVTADGVKMHLYIDEVEIGTGVAVAVVPNVPGTDWILMQNSSLLSLEYLKVSP